MSAAELAAQRIALINAKLAASGKIPAAAMDPRITHHGDGFMREIEVNDSPNRYLAVRRPLLDELERINGVAVSVRGKYIADKSQPSAEKPLYLCIQGRTIQSVEDASKRIEAVLAQETEKPKPFEEKVSIFGVESFPGFDLKTKLTGPNNAYIDHIVSQSGASVTLRGRGSGYFEMGAESPEPLYFLISHVNRSVVQSAKSLCLNLIQTVKKDYEAAIAPPPPVAQPPPPPQPAYYPQYSGYGYQQQYGMGYDYGMGYVPVAPVVAPVRPPPVLPPGFEPPPPPPPPPVEAIPTFYQAVGAGVKTSADDADDHVAKIAKTSDSF